MLVADAIDFLMNLSTRELIGYFWPFFLIDMSRYVILDVVVLSVYAFRQKRQEPQREAARKRLYAERPLVSILVPGKNEGKHIPRLADTIKQQTYRNHELVIVDDGSDDDTAEICRRLKAEGKIDVFVRNEVRGGKASAANTGLQFVRGKYVIHLDADSHVLNDSIERILLPFYMDARIGAVGGDVRVSNTDASFAATVQGIEYLKSISTGRTVASQLGILRMIAGAHGAFRTDVLRRLKGWDPGPGLDGDITLKIRKLGFRVVHEPLAACYTNAPQTFAKLARQRFRWDRSMIRYRVRKHRDILLPSANFSISDFIASVENIFFNLLMDAKWWMYITYMAVYHAEKLPYLMVINYLLYAIANVIQFTAAWLLLRKSLRRQDFLLALYVPLMPLYTGLFIRFVRTYAYLMETFHRVSYNDPWNPWKVSRISRDEGL